MGQHVVVVVGVNRDIVDDVVVVCVIHVWVTTVGKCVCWMLFLIICSRETFHLLIACACPRLVGLNIPWLGGLACVGLTMLRVTAFINHFPCEVPNS